MKFIQQNIVPINFVLMTTCIGYFLGHTTTGLVIGVLIVSLVTLRGQLFLKKRY